MEKPEGSNTPIKMTQVQLPYNRHQAAFGVLGQSRTDQHTQAGGELSATCVNVGKDKTIAHHHATLKPEMTVIARITMEESKRHFQGHHQLAIPEESSQRSHGMQAPRLFVQAAEAMIAAGYAGAKHVEKSSKFTTCPPLCQEKAIPPKPQMPKLAPPPFLSTFSTAEQFLHPPSTRPINLDLLSRIAVPIPAVRSTTIGVGVHAGHSDSDTYFDATQAAVLALKDALDRSNLNLSLRSNIQVHVKLGIPAEPQSSTTPMAVDMGRLALVLPSSVTVAPMSTVVGGLFCPGGPGQELSLCSVVACLTVLHAERGEHASTEVSQMSPVPEARTVEVPVVASTRVLLPRATLAGSPMDMLAQISEEVQEKARIQQEKEDNRGGVAYPRILHLNHHIHQAQEGKDSSLCVDGSHRDDCATEKKLRVVVASNELQSSHVQHSYTDHTRQRYTPDDAELVVSGKAYNTAFPVKLHDALSEIEADGKEQIVSWQPHGRAFKIHNQEAFEDEILPKYFVMTKKTSFLRQLNLYGFHRLSGTSLDKGGYYHELFLRGMPFLSRRMRRQKINGNGIRAAANPAQEPDFYKMPAVLPVMEAFSSSSMSMTESSTDDPDDDFIEEGSAGITSVIKMVPSRAHNHVSFPLKLHMMLDTLDAQGNRDVISWMPDGRGFIVHQQDVFASDIMPSYFRQTKFSSFQRQLNMYSFQRISRGQDMGGYYHSCFLRGRPELCRRMSRTSINGKGWHKQPSSDDPLRVPKT